MTSTPPPVAPGLDDAEHGLDDAYYSNLPGPRQACIIRCLCGWYTSFNSSWEDAGRELDEHLKETS